MRTFSANESSNADTADAVFFIDGCDSLFIEDHSKLEPEFCTSRRLSYARHLRARR